MKNKNLILIVIAVVFSTKILGQYEDDVFTGNSFGSSWMQFVQSKKLNELSIPGTHDSGAITSLNNTSFGGYSNAQDKTITQQLELGVRFLDIRVKLRPDGKFWVFHGSDRYEHTIDNVITACQNFLIANTTEVIIMSIKDEGGGSDAFKSGMNTKVSVPVFYNAGQTITSIPTVLQAKGKIVLINRYGNVPNQVFRGISTTSWGDNQLLHNVGTLLKVQDKYNLDADAFTSQAGYSGNNKKGDIKATIDSSRLSTNGRLHINFWSGSGDVHLLDWIANNINSDIYNHIKNTSWSKIGVNMLDFINAKYARSIYMYNFPIGAVLFKAINHDYTQPQVRLRVFPLQDFKTQYAKIPIIGLNQASSIDVKANCYAFVYDSENFQAGNASFTADDLNFNNNTWTTGGTVDNDVDAIKIKWVGATVSMNTSNDPKEDNNAYFKDNSVENTVNSTLDVFNEKISPSVNLFPNPAENNFHVLIQNVTENEKVTIKMIDFTGKIISQVTEVLNFEINEYTYDCSSVQSGYYLILMEFADGSIQKQNLSIK